MLSRAGRVPLRQECGRYLRRPYVRGFGVGPGVRTARNGRPRRWHGIGRPGRGCLARCRLAWRRFPDGRGGRLGYPRRGRRPPFGCGRALSVRAGSGRLIDGAVPGGAVEGAVRAGFVDGAVPGGAVEGAVRAGFVDGAVPGGAVESAVRGRLVDGAVPGGAVESAVRGRLVDGVAPGGPVDGAVGGGLVQCAGPERAFPTPWPVRLRIVRARPGADRGLALRCRWSRILGGRPMSYDGGRALRCDRSGIVGGGPVGGVLNPALRCRRPRVVRGWPMRRRRRGRAVRRRRPGVVSRWPVLCRWNCPVGWDCPVRRDPVRCDPVRGHGPAPTRGFAQRRHRRPAVRNGLRPVLVRLRPCGRAVHPRLVGRGRPQRRVRLGERIDRGTERIGQTVERIPRGWATGRMALRLVVGPGVTPTTSSSGGMRVVRVLRPRWPVAPLRVRVLIRPFVPVPAWPVRRRLPVRHGRQGTQVERLVPIRRSGLWITSRSTGTRAGATSTRQARIAR